MDDDSNFRHDLLPLVPYYSFVKPAKLAPPAGYLDYIMVDWIMVWLICHTSGWRRRWHFNPNAAVPKLQLNTGCLRLECMLPFDGFSFDQIQGTKFGGTIFDENGHRHPAADLLEPRAYSVLFKGSHGVMHKAFLQAGQKNKDSYGVTHKAFLQPGQKNKVILSAGALGSPRLLMLSGIGSSSQLKFHGIDVALDQPQVGQGMADNFMNLVNAPSLIDVEFSLIEAVEITQFDSFIEASSRSSSIRAFMQNLHEAAQMLSSQVGVWQLQKDVIRRAIEFMNSVIKGTFGRGFVLEKIAGLISSGYLHLTSFNPNDNPAVRFNYFQAPEDLQKCVKGMEIIIKVVESKRSSKFHITGMAVQALLNLVVTLPVDKAVEKDYMAIGTEGLGVIAGSTFHESPGTNPQAIVMMFGRYNDF
ncbi:hypothetical protein Cgig2_010558 [Carnegiea gigantea]|uniref:Glucose-methanol-choline oxidoreductase N-terminal domain-containing protein n=1 Tax=Carnegiea gigantea TaxID=171969 RepID=A0A9Q1KTQ9_9CARY|nr:hypothetical protein Cgig2_010558 [Carnegiea gigantea]